MTGELHRYLLADSRSPHQTPHSRSTIVVKMHTWTSGFDAGGLPCAFEATNRESCFLTTPVNEHIWRDNAGAFLDVTAFDPHVLEEFLQFHRQDEFAAFTVLGVSDIDSQIWTVNIEEHIFPPFQAELQLATSPPCAIGHYRERTHIFGQEWQNFLELIILEKSLPGVVLGELPELGQ